MILQKSSSYKKKIKNRKNKSSHVSLSAHSALLIVNKGQPTKLIMIRIMKESLYNSTTRVQRIEPNINHCHHFLPRRNLQVVDNNNND